LSGDDDDAGNRPGSVPAATDDIPTAGATSLEPDMNLHLIKHTEASMRFPAMPCPCQSKKSTLKG
jgi:hypothetical protein